MSKIIQIVIADKRPSVLGTPVIVCGNSDYTVEFTFDAEWDDLTEKVARFVYVQEGTVKYQDVPFTGTTVAVPALSTIKEVMVGVYAGELRTTTPARIPCDYSILCGNAVENGDPQARPDLQAQIGDLGQLITEENGSIVAAINWLYGNITGGLVVTVTATQTGPGSYSYSMDSDYATIKAEVDEGKEVIIRCQRTHNKQIGYQYYMYHRLIQPGMLGFMSLSTQDGTYELMGINVLNEVYITTYDMPVLKTTAQELTDSQKEQARENIGAASTSDIDTIKTGLDCITTPIGVFAPVEFEPIKCGLISNSGKVSTNNASSYYISPYVPVTPGETLYITANEHYGNAYYAFYNSDNAPVLIRHDNSSSSTATPIFDEEVVVPVTAATVVIAYFGTVAGMIKRKVPNGGLKFQPWKGRVWTVVGDSLTERDSDIPMTYHDYVAEATGISVVNLGYSGSGYAKTGAGQAFHLRINKVPANSDVVTIFGSFNDLSSGLELGTPSDTGTETICGCINTTIDNLIAVMPAVCLGIVTPTPWKSGNPANPDNGQTKYADALVEICKNRSIPCLDLYRCSNLRPWSEEGQAACYSTDNGNGCHPDATGHKLIAARFKAFLESLIL